MKFKRYHKLRVPSVTAAKNNPSPDAGPFVIRVKEPGRLTKIHLNAVRKAVRRAIRRNGKLILVGSSMHPITAKPAEIRMGKGKGSVDYWATPVTAGTPVAQMRGLSRQLARKALFTAQTKLPLRSYVETRIHYNEWDDYMEWRQFCEKRRLRVIGFRGCRPRVAV